MVLLGTHLLWCVARAPGRVFARRLDDVAQHRVAGAVGFFLDGRQLGGADAVSWILEHAPPDAVVLWRGEVPGALEFVPAMLAPRLVVAESACPAPVASYLGRPLAVRRGADGSETVVVIHGLGKSVRLEAR